MVGRDEAEPGEQHGELQTAPRVQRRMTVVVLRGLLAGRRSTRPRTRRSMWRGPSELSVLTYWVPPFRSRSQGVATLA